MSRIEPKHMIVEFVDGTRREIEFGRLSRVAQAEISKLGNFPLPSDQKYIWLKWKDGWQEVMAVEGGCLDLFRYYLLQRMEAHGRLCIKRSGPYPLVRNIGRLPSELEQVMLTDGKLSMTYALSVAKDARVEGGKTEVQYELEPIDSNPVSELKERLNKVLKGHGEKADKLLTAGHMEKLDAYKLLREGINVRAYEKEGDALAFIELLLKKVAEPRE